MKYLIYLSFAIFIISCNSNTRDKYDLNLSENEIDRLGQIADFYHNGQFTLVIDSGNVFIEQYPKNDMGPHLMSSAYLALGMDSLAREYVDKTLVINPQNHVALLNKAILLDKTEEYEKAKEFYEKSLKIEPNLAQTYSNYSGNRLNVKDYQEAIRLMEKSIELADKTGDKGVLCALYHETEQFDKRDSLLIELEALNYVNLEKLKEVIKE